MCGFRTNHQVAAHIRLLVNSNRATQRAAEQTNPRGEGESDCELDRELDNKCYRLRASIGEVRLRRYDARIPNGNRAAHAEAAAKLAIKKH
jgi:hypothetical protein